MKKILLMFLPVLLLVASCEKNYLVPNKTIIVNVASGSWLPLNGKTSYKTAINLPELDSYINEQGGVLVYLSFGEEAYEQIPQVFKGESYSFVTRPGQLVLQNEYLNGAIMEFPPQNMTVKIILMESEYD